jgi:hypothetical protein
LTAKRSTHDRGPQACDATAESLSLIAGKLESLDHSVTPTIQLAAEPQKLEYDFFEGNWSVGDQYYDTIRD